MNLENFFSAETQQKIKNDIAGFLKRYNIDVSDPNTKRAIDDRIFEIFKLILSLLIFKK